MNNDDVILELRDKLNDLISNHGHKNEILKASQELDNEIINYYLSKD
ncbi:MAG: aspartyl-phosphate phosphatase Spo0E family protein [Solirubrobacterales bacterium]